MDKEEFIKLIDFIDKNLCVEIRIEKNNQVTLWIPFIDLEEFTDIFGYDYFCEGGIECTLLNDSVAIDLQDFLEDEDLEIIRTRYGEE